MRVLLAGLVGGVVLFAWGALSHMATPLATMGMDSMDPAREEAVIDGMRSAMSERKIYMFPGYDVDDPAGMEQQPFQSRYERGPTGLVVYVPGPGVEIMATNMVEEFLLNVLEALIAAWIVSRLAPAVGFGTRVMIVTAIGLSAVLTTEGSYWIWYRFPTEYFVGQLVMTVVGAFLAGLVIAKMVRPRAADAA